MTDQTANTTADGQTDFRDLGGFARTCFTREHHDLVGCDYLRNFLAFFTDWQRRKFNLGRNKLLATSDIGLGLSELVLPFLQCLVMRLAGPR